jgi:hypothetical protein
MIAADIWVANQAGRGECLVVDIEMLFLAKVIARLSPARQRRVRNLLKGKADPRDGVRRAHGYKVPVACASPAIRAPGARWLKAVEPAHAVVKYQCRHSTAAMKPTESNP